MLRLRQHSRRHRLRHLGEFGLRLADFRPHVRGLGERLLVLVEQLDEPLEFLIVDLDVED
ncbi:MAG: hypothetical protein ACYCUE_01210 [Steroidobacteraceae bacterium]